MSQSDLNATEPQPVDPAAEAAPSPVPAVPDAAAPVAGSEVIEVTAVEQSTTTRGWRGKTVAAPVSEIPVEDVSTGPIEIVAPIEAPTDGEPAPVETVAQPRPRGRPAQAGKPAGDLRQALRQAIDAQGLSLTEAAAAIGVAVPGLRRVLSGESRPNSRTLSAYTAWLGGEAGAAKPAKADRIEKPARTSVSHKAAFRALRDLIKQAVSQPEAGIDPGLAALGADQLALRVHRASASTRRVIAAALASLPR